MLRDVFGFFRIERLPPDQLEELSTNLHKLARHINFIAVRKRRNQEPEDCPHETHKRRVMEACKEVYEKQDQFNLEWLILNASFKHDVSQKAILLTLPVYKRRRTQIRKIEHEREIMRL